MHEDALINLVVSLIVMPPFMLLAWVVIRRTPTAGQTGAYKWHAYRIRLTASALIVFGAAMILWFAVSFVAAVG